MSGYFNVFTRTRGRRPVKILAQFTVNAANDPVIISHDSLSAAGLASATHTATGKYTFVTLDGFSRILQCQATYAATGDAENLYAQPDPGTLAAGTGVCTQIIRTKAAGTNTDPAATANVLNLEITFEN